MVNQIPALKTEIFMSFFFLIFSHRRDFENLVYEEWVQEEIGMREILQVYTLVYIWH